MHTETDEDAITELETDAEMDALLPGGLRDLLPEEAVLHAETIQKLVAVFSAFGYRHVKPPLIEFEESLLGGVSGAVGNQTFRLMDPISQRMMGIHALHENHLTSSNMVTC